jgi:hypothetical protein
VTTTRTTTALGIGGIGGPADGSADARVVDRDAGPPIPPISPPQLLLGRRQRPHRVVPVADRQLRLGAARRVLGVIAIADDVVEGFENSVRQPVLPDELPDDGLTINRRPRNLGCDHKDLLVHDGIAERHRAADSKAFALGGRDLVAHPLPDQLAFELGK